MTVSIDITSDTVCPWCFVGKRRLEAGLREAGAVDDTLVTWHPFQLDPRVPVEGLGMTTYLESKFGPKQNWQPMLDRLTAIGEECGIAFAWDAIKVRPNSIDSHRVIRWAGPQGQGDVTLQNAVVERLFTAYWEQGRDIGAPEVLAELSGEAGMDSGGVLRRLGTEEDRELVLQESQMAAYRGVTGVPDFVIGQRFRLVGAQPPYYFQRALERLGDAA